ncbi:MULTISPECIES: 2-succinyl-5-enolpyruvyl-6-hydroxy-3-cyclohexene-1-carboxylic-acid synthase [unclassified Vibrio]|uniref:2-succinyl-5-enolpyruvyl-6-hydroxy-3- cyclohexene-1-carboxylic-acid synthase n=1 Tax=unclassified Vibrio TaxID=2614977 RepID=UPI00148386E7|nr:MULTISPECIES: 2-succinyl-5-enolpyruvyl-6-hydroxy-3-cyclohexene-1-carboxylic-acid synthase [unclassified Vibrio]NNN43463.1 2-succinyl-5-enolpyruvyl-6-hydroxy-3-cyclohexene-1-carboxylic-acid synthase [Vibrio sp. 1-1(7)]NNN71287.1 2-succinyl-5-enolpyruvyl-6-hydroxy-3-cyclohexene-1-carboxylic-acid synthase [Vibrio sp. 12-2(3-a)]
MNQDQALLNRIWSQTLLEELARFGVSEVCIAPGSRSTPLTLEAADNGKFNLHTHFDERGLGFLALGLAKASAKPVAIIVTSGTAVANLLPAIAESKLTGEPLIVLTADRPVDLVGCGANQAIEQSGIYGCHVTQSIALPSPNVSLSLNWLLTTLDDALYQQSQFGGAIHINCPFPEPLYAYNDRQLYADYLNRIESWRKGSAPYTQRHYASASIDPIDKRILSKKGVVLIGSVRLHEAQAALEFAKQLGWPVLCDPQSGVSSEWAHYDLWLQNSAARVLLSECQQVIQFGARIVSKRLNYWLEQRVSSGECDYAYLAWQATRNNQSHLAQQHWVCDMVSWVKVQLNTLPALKQTHSGWANELKNYARSVTQLAQLHFSNPQLSEVALALDLSERGQLCDLFLGNSLIVRLADMFTAFTPREVFSNRGASGIDGLLATASGVQRASRKPMLTLLGDTSLLYDLNSLALVRETPQPLVIVVINNDGGAIFDLLPVPEQQREALYQMPHGLQFEYVAKQFGLAYQKPETLAAYQAAIETHLTTGQGTLLIEVITPPQQAAAHIQQLLSQIHAL